MAQKQFSEKYLSMMLESPAGYVADQRRIRHDRNKHRRRDRKRKKKSDDLLQIDPGFSSIMKSKNTAIRKARFKVTCSGKTHLRSLSFTTVSRLNRLLKMTDFVTGLSTLSDSEASFSPCIRSV